MARYIEPYSLYRRRVRSDKIVRYYRSYDARGRRTVGRSTGQTSKTFARQHCQKLIAEGKLIPRNVPTLAEWAQQRRWWVWDECQYCRGRLARSEPDKPAITRRYADDALRILNQRILPAHGTKRLDAISPGDLESLLFQWSDQGSSYKTVTNWASVYRVMLSEAHRLGIIESNPWDRVPAFTPASKPRGVLTAAEAFRLLNPATVATIREGHHLYYTIKTGSSDRRDATG